MNGQWYRVTTKRPCTICGKVDWCTYGENVSGCMRVQSDHPMRNGGWLHRDEEPVRYIPKPPPMPAIPETPPDFEGMWSTWNKRTDFEMLDKLGVELNVDTDALKDLDCVWNGHAWAFPMRDAESKMVGIRLRNETGKWAVKGSHQALFIPKIVFGRMLYIVEGPTDCAAGLTIGLQVIGRPSCLGQEQMIKAFVKRKQVREVVIITDNDEPGLRGAAKLQESIGVASCIWVPPCKDLREFVKLRGTQPMIESSVKDLVWTRA